MDPLDFSIEDVVKKWGVHQQDSDIKFEKSDDSLWYRQRSSFPSNQSHRKRRKNVQKESLRNIPPRKFSILPPSLQTCFQVYQVSSCKLCQNVIKTIKIKDSSQSQTVDLCRFISKHKRFTKYWFYQLFINLSSPVCFQSKDQVILQQIKQNNHSLIFIYDGCSLLQTIFVFIYIAAIQDEVPAVFVDEKFVSSSLLRYLMEKIGFVFMKEPTDVLEKVCSLYDNNKSFILPKSTSLSSISNLLLNELRKRGCKSDTLIVPVACSTENQNNGFTYLSLSLPVYLKSLLEHAHDMNDHEIKDEENSLINRHLNHDLLQASVVLPIHLLSFALLVRHRDGVKNEELECSLEEILEELKSMDIFLGFSGDIESVTMYGIEILCNQKLVSIVNNVVTPLLHDPITACSLFTYSLKILQILMPKVILACSIVCTIGGEFKLLQGNGRPFAFRSQQVLENAEFLAELFSYLFDYHCPFSIFLSMITDALEKFVTIDVLASPQESFEDQRHKKLAENLKVGFIDEEEEVWGGADSENGQIFEFIPSESNIQILSYWRACAAPFIEIVYLITSLVHLKKSDEYFTATDIFSCCQQRFKDGLFANGEVIDYTYAVKCLEYLFEKEFIDDIGNDNTFVQSTTHDLLQFLAFIVKFRI